MRSIAEARSCPPIAFYSPENLTLQLDIATRAYLSDAAQYDAPKNIVQLPALMSWFRADFGGKKGMRQLLKKVLIIPADSRPKITFKKYDWKLFLDHYNTKNE